MTTYKTSHTYIERAQHSRLRTNTRSDPAASRTVQTSTTPERPPASPANLRDSPTWLSVSVGPAHPLSHEKSALQRPDQKKFRMGRAASRASTGARTDRQTPPAQPRAAYATRLRRQQRWSPEVPQYARTRSSLGRLRDGRDFVHVWCT